MAKISSGSIQWLTRFLGVPKLTSQTTDLEDGHVQLVSDITRPSGFELSNGERFGYWIVSAFQAHVGAGFISNEVALTNPLVPAHNYRFDPVKEWAWLISEWGMADSQPNFVSAIIGLGESPGHNAVGPSDQAAEAAGYLTWMSTGATAQNLKGDLALIPDLPPHPPILIVAPEIGIDLNSRATIGAVKVSLNAMIWIGPTGLMPPGMS